MRFHHAAFRTRDLPRLRAFYVDVLGFSVERERDGSVWLRTGDPASRVMLESALPAEPRIPDGSLELVAFAIDPSERNAWVERLGRAGVAIEATTDFTLYFRDPDGRRIAVSCYEFGPTSS